jgi:hypothetical protein
VGTGSKAHAVSTSGKLNSAHSRPVSAGALSAPGIAVSHTPPAQPPFMTDLS